MLTRNLAIERRSRISGSNKIEDEFRENALKGFALFAVGKGATLQLQVMVTWAGDVQGPRGGVQIEARMAERRVEFLGTGSEILGVERG